MNNYEYIIASLPEIDLSDAGSGKMPEDVTEFIKEQLSDKDNIALQTLYDIWNPAKMDGALYAKALSSSSRFIREYCLFDLQVKNEKVRHLNKALGREPERDVIKPEAPENTPIGEEPDYSPESELAEQLRKIYSGTDILEKESAIDKLTWEKIDELTTFEDFSLDAVLAFVAKLHIILRWLKLDAEKGRRLFRELTDQVRGSHAKLEFTA